MAPDGDLARVVATLRAFLERADALRAVLLLDRGAGAGPVVVDCAADGSAEVVEDGAVRVWAGPQDAEPYAVPEHVHPFPPLEVELGGTEPSVQSPMGVLDHLARAVRDTAELFPGQSVLTVGFESSDPEAPVFLAARRDEPLVLSLAGAEYEMPAGWPGEPGAGGPLQL